MKGTLVTTTKEVKQLVTRHMGEDFAFDVETSGLEYLTDDLLGLALYFEGGDMYYIVLAHTVGDTPTEYKHKVFMTPQAFYKEIHPLFEKDQLMLAHNAKFDLHFLRKHDVVVSGRLADTLLAAQLLNENRSNGLKSLSANLLNSPYAKYDTMNFYKGFTSKQILGGKLEDIAEYAMNDVEATWKLWKLFHPLLATESHKGIRLLDIFNDIWMPLLITLFEMEERGIAVDIDLVHSIRTDYIEVRDRCLKSVTEEGIKMILARYELNNIPMNYMRTVTAEEIEDAYEDAYGNSVFDDVNGVQLPIITHDMVGKTKAWRARTVEFLPSSPQQVAELVFEWAKLTVPENVKLKLSKSTHNYAADKDNLQTIIFYNPTATPQYVKDLLEFRKAEKFIGTYLDVFIKKGVAEDNNAIHTSFAMAVSDNGSGGTATGRLSSYGPNLQNIPSRGEVGARARKMFISRPNHILGVADLSQAELRMLAHYSGDKALLEAFEKEQDLHIVTGAGLGRITYEELFALVEEEDPEGKKLRMLGKTANFGLTYGMGAAKFQRFILVNNNYEISVAQAQELIDLYNSTYSGATKWKEQVVKAAHRLGYVATLYGRKRRLPDLQNPVRWIRSGAERQAINAVIQGSVGDVICEAMIQIQPRLKEIGGSILLQVHDELVTEVPLDKQDEAKYIIETHMTARCNTVLSVPQVADCSFGLNWSDAKH